MAITTTRYDNVHGVPLSVTVGGVSSVLLPDHQGNIVGRIDSTQTVVGKTWYWPYGERRTGSHGLRLGYGGAWGYYADSSTNRLYIRARYLKPNWTRWLTADPLWPRQQGYGYAGSSPITRVDPTGLYIKVKDCKPADDAAINTAIARLKAVLSPLCPKPDSCASDAVKECWRQAGDSRWQIEGDCFCKHGNGDAGFNLVIDCNYGINENRCKSSSGPGVEPDCAATDKGSWHADCSIRICPDVCNRLGIDPSYWDQVIFHELTHCCGATHSSGKSGEADIGKLLSCLRKAAGWTPIEPWKPQ